MVFIFFFCSSHFFFVLFFVLPAGWRQVSVSPPAPAGRADASRQRGGVRFWDPPTGKKKRVLGKKNLEKLWFNYDWFNLVNLFGPVLIFIWLIDNWSWFSLLLWPLRPFWPLGPSKNCWQTMATSAGNPRWPSGTRSSPTLRPCPGGRTRREFFRTKPPERKTSDVTTAIAYNSNIVRHIHPNCCFIELVN